MNRSLSALSSMILFILTLGGPLSTAMAEDDEEDEQEENTGIGAVEAQQKAQHNLLESEKMASVIKQQLQQESARKRTQASLTGPGIAKDAGVTWTFKEETDPKTNKPVLSSVASFIGEGGLHVTIEAVCLTANKRLTVSAMAFDNHDQPLPFLTNQDKVSLRVNINQGGPQAVLMSMNQNVKVIKDMASPVALLECNAIIRNSPDAASVQAMLVALRGAAEALRVDSIASLPNAEAMINNMVNRYPIAACYFQNPSDKWLELTEINTIFPLAQGDVMARMTPYESNIHKVLVACADRQ